VISFTSGEGLAARFFAGAAFFTAVFFAVVAFLTGAVFFAGALRERAGVVMFPPGCND
jgi:hypothetical protein